MEWKIIKSQKDYPEEGLEVLCAITKHGNIFVDKIYTEPYVDFNGKFWYRVGEQVEYMLLWREGSKWVHWDIDDYEGNADYMRVIAWSNRLDFKLKDE